MGLAILFKAAILVLASVIAAESLDVRLELSLDHDMKLDILVENFRFLAQQINPAISRIIANESTKIHTSTETWGTANVRTDSSNSAAAETPIGYSLQRHVT